MRTRFFVGLGVVGVLVLLMTGVALAKGDELGGKLLSGNDVTIPADQTVDHDLYVFGNSIVSNGTINGDLVVGGASVDINGAVNGDVIAAAGRISINGAVSGDIRAGGGQVLVDGDVSEDLLVAGGQVTVGGRVGQDLIVSAGVLTLSGSVAGSTIGTAGTYDKSGTIAGSDGITVTGTGSALVLPPSNPVLDAVRQFLGVLLVAVLALWLVPRTFVAAEAQLRERPLPSFVWGIVAVIGYIVAIIAIVVLAVIAAIVLGLFGFMGLLGLELLAGFVAFLGITLAFFVAAGFLVDAVVGLALARLLVARTGSAMALTPGGMRGPWADLGLLAVGAAVVVILTSLPVLGGSVRLVVVFFGLGALWLAWRVGPRATAAPTA